MYYNLICILYALLCGQNFILVKSGCYRGLLRFLAGHMIDPTTHEILLPLRFHLVSCSRSGRLGGTLPRKMASQPTLETSSTNTVSLRWCTVRGWGIGAGALLHALARWLLPIGSRWLLLRPLRLEARTLGLKVRPLCQKLRARHLHWHRWLVHLEWLVKLVRLCEARPNITPRGLSKECHFSLAILLHFSDLGFNDSGFVDHVLEVGIVGVEQMELNVIIQPIQEHVLLLLIHVDVVRGIP
jgi:hypothetical protein